MSWSPDRVTDEAGLEIRVRRLSANGVPSSHIARRLGVPRWKVNRILRKRKDDRGRCAK